MFFEVFDDVVFGGAERDGVWVGGVWAGGVQGFIHPFLEPFWIGRGLWFLLLRVMVFPRG